MTKRKPATINVKPHKATISDKPKPADNQSSNTTNLFVIGIFLAVLLLLEQLGGGK